MSASFCDLLLRWARSTNPVDDDTFESARELVLKFIGHIGVDFFEVQHDGIQSDHRPGLTTTGKWTNGKANSTPILNEDGSYRDQTTFAYDTESILWVTEASGEVLTERAKFKNWWPDSQDLRKLPDYWPFVTGMRTQIVFPLSYANQVFGVMTLETKRYLEYSPSVARELKTLAKAIAVLHWHHREGSERESAAKDRLLQLNELLPGRRLQSPLMLRKVFVASASSASDDVEKVISNVLAEFSRDLEVVHWKRITASGNITTHLLQAIGDCSLGVCYLSEPLDTRKKSTAYRDNPNVVFEAGMLQALTHWSDGKSVHWIPIREKNSPPTPFDFAQQRTIEVPRKKNGSLAVEAFEKSLRELVRTAIQADAKGED
jgi:hypothetical protein